MTTININKLLLEQVQDLLYRVTRWKGENHEVLTDLHDIKEAVKAVLAAPATAPAWHDAPTVPGLWMCNYGDLSVATVNQPDIDTFDPAYNTGGRWYGPIPEDRQ